MSEELQPGQAREVAAWNAAKEFARKCRDIEEHAAADSQTTLGIPMNALMTELWDQGFSQDEIRQAFDEAVADMGRYAAGEKRNGTGIRGTALR